MERLRQEIILVMGNEEHPTRAQIRKMSYLSFVIKESMKFNCSLLIVYLLK
jgi:hypothetical protein